VETFLEPQAQKCDTDNARQGDGELSRHSYGGGNGVYVLHVHGD